jgi:hypothetical protein
MFLRNVDDSLQNYTVLTPGDEAGYTAFVPSFAIVRLPDYV